MEPEKSSFSGGPTETRVSYGFAKHHRVANFLPTLFDKSLQHDSGNERVRVGEVEFFQDGELAKMEFAGISVQSTRIRLHGTSESDFFSGSRFRKLGPSRPARNTT